ncbi:MAG: nucleotidyltransferase family protein [Bacteroidales bacterium]|nr:nucleotidyltransferase family protein [Bacteroidales bacterium]
MLEAIVLAGGFGTRLRSVVSDVPKPMAPVAGRPFLCHLLDALKKEGYSHVVLATGYLHEKVEDYFGNEYNGLKIDYAVEHEPLGTGGAIVNGLQHCESDKVTVLNGDTLFLIDHQSLISVCNEKETPLTIALRHVEDSGRYGSVETDEDGRITAFVEKNDKGEAGYINGGIYRLDRHLLDSFPLGQQFSFEKEVLQKEYRVRPFYGVRFQSYFIDIGIPEDYEKANYEF